MKANFIIVVSEWGFYYQLIELAQLLKVSNVNVLILSYNLTESQFSSLKTLESENFRLCNINQSKALECLSFYRNYIIHKFLRKNIIRRHKSVVVFFEKPSLLFFNAFYRLSNIKIVYWSLELYLNPNDDVFRHIPRLKKLRKLEERNCSNFDLLIIQDRFRAAEFLGKANVKIERFYWPVTALRNRINNQTINFNTTLIYIGAIRAERSLDSLFELTNQNQIGLVLNGVVTESYKAKILSKFENIKFSFSESIENIEIQGEIGVVWYDERDTNDSLTGYSSEKIAIYLYHGIPFITNIKNDSFRHLFLSKSAFFVDAYNFDIVIQKIKKNYKIYSDCAKLEFNRTYDSEIYFQRLINHLALL
jgi:hypothetical protein